MKKDTRRKSIIGHVFLAPLALAIVTSSVQAHDDAEWIQKEPRYVDANGTHCCNKHDCGRIESDLVREIEPGVWVYLPTGQRFNHGERGTYASKDVTFWACKYAMSEKVRCLFSPGGMF